MRSIRCSGGGLILSSAPRSALVRLIDEIRMNRISVTITIQDIARQMRLLRRKKGLAQKEVAHELKITQSTLSKIERGVLEPSASQWMIFCLLVGVDMDIIVREKSSS